MKAVTGLGDSKLPHQMGDRLKNAGFQKRNSLDRLRAIWVLLLGIIKRFRRLSWEFFSV